MTFEEDATWQRAKLPIGYGDDDDETVLTDMRRGYQTIYLRKTFTIEDSVPSSLLLHLYLDDGAVIWINGFEVARAHVPDGDLRHDSAAINHEANWQRILLRDTQNFLESGTNVVAVHALNQSANSSDFSFDLELLTPHVTVGLIESVEKTITGEITTRRFLPQTYPGSDPPSRGIEFPGTGNYAGTRFRIQTIDEEVSYSASGHARTVGNFLFGQSQSVFPGVPLVECHSASDWLNRSIRSGSNRPPEAGLEWVQNHSWIQNLSQDVAREELEDILLRVDYMIERDQVLSVVGLNNGATTTVPPVLASAYNVLSVGLTNGNHSRGGSPNNFPGPGRSKPEIVAANSATSYSTAMVTSAVARLLNEAFQDNSLSEALPPQTLKAIILAGATQDGFPKWQSSSEAPLDSVFGAGKLNLERSLQILTDDPTSSPSIQGWRSSSISPGTAIEVAISPPRGFQVDRVNAALCWHRIVTNTSQTGGFSPQSSLANLSLRLKSTMSPFEVAVSDSAIDNVEYLALDVPPNLGDLAFEIRTEAGAVNASRFGFAWIAEITPVLQQPQLQIEIVKGQLRFHFSALNPGNSYAIERSPDLVSWSTASQFTATSESQILSEPVPSKGSVYLRLRTLPSDTPPPNAPQAID